MLKITSRRSLVTVMGALGAVMLLSGCSVLSSFLPSQAPTRDAATGEISESQDNADVFSIRVGDCLNSSALGEEVYTVPVVPCGEPHEDEVFHSVIMEDGDFPGEEAIDAVSREQCTAEFNSFIGMPYEESILDWWPLYPIAGSWENGDREILCIAYDPESLTVGSLRGSVR